MTALRNQTECLIPLTRRQRVGEALRQLAAFGLLAVLAGRMFISELPFRSSLFSSIGSGAFLAESGFGADMTELSRVSFAVILLAVATVWAVGSALVGRLVIGKVSSTVLIAAFLVLSVFSALYAGDKRSAWDVWIEQAALLASFIVAADLFADCRRFYWLVAVLVAVGATLAAKEAYQIWVEIPQRIADFQTYRTQRLAYLGLEEGSAEAAIFEARLRSTTPTAFFVMSNLLATAMLIMTLAAVGLTIDKFRSALSARQAWRAKAGEGEIHAPTLAAIFTAVLAVISALGLVLTRSRAGITAAAVMLVAFAAIWRWRAVLAAHWRRAVVVAAMAFILAAGAVVAYGMRFDRLPGKSMTFRWYYWTGSAEIVRNHPLLGVGGGNFPDAYLRYRRAKAEESVKEPHNVIMHALAQYGIPGGLCYLAIIGVALAGMCRRQATASPGRSPAPPVRSTARLPCQGPGPGKETLPEVRPMPLKRVIIAGAAIVLSVLAARAIFGGAMADKGYFVLEAVLPAAVLAGALAAALWAGETTGSALSLPKSGVSLQASRLAIGCGAAGFMLHGMFEFSPWAPATGLLFWLCAGACLAGGDRTRSSSLARWPIAILVLAATVSAAVLLWMPVYQRTVNSEAAIKAMAEGDVSRAKHYITAAADADLLDAFAPADVARFVMGQTGEDDALMPPKALTWALLAVRGDRNSYANWRLAAEIAWFAEDGDAWRYHWPVPEPRQVIPAAGDDPVALSIRAWKLYAKGKYEEAAKLLQSAISGDPNSPTLQANLGAAEFMDGRGDLARAAWIHAAELAAARGVDHHDSLEYSARAVRLNPMDLRLLIFRAKMLLDAGETAAARVELAAAEHIDNQLPRESLVRLKEFERQELKMLWARSEAIAEKK